MSRVIGSSLSSRQTSYPDLPGMTTSSSTRSGRSEWTSSLPSSASVAVSTSYPREVRSSRRRRTVSSLSSITRIFGARCFWRVYSSKVRSESGPISVMRRGRTKRGCIALLCLLSLFNTLQSHPSAVRLSEMAFMRAGRDCSEPAP